MPAVGLEPTLNRRSSGCLLPLGYAGVRVGGGTRTLTSRSLNPLALPLAYTDERDESMPQRRSREAVVSRACNRKDFMNLVAENGIEPSSLGL